MDGSKEYTVENIRFNWIFILTLFLVNPGFAPSVGNGTRIIIRETI